MDKWLCMETSQSCIAIFRWVKTALIWFRLVANIGKYMRKKRSRWGRKNFCSCGKPEEDWQFKLRTYLRRKISCIWDITGRLLNEKKQTKDGRSYARKETKCINFLFLSMLNTLLSFSKLCDLSYYIAISWYRKIIIRINYYAHELRRAKDFKLKARIIISAVLRVLSSQCWFLTLF